MTADTLFMAQISLSRPIAGRSTIPVTLGTYGHVFPSLEASLTAALDDVYRMAESAPPADGQEMGG